MPGIGQFDPNTVQQVRNDLFTGGLYNPYGQAAVLGNIAQESGFNPNISNSVGPGHFGLFQDQPSRFIGGGIDQQISEFTNPQLPANQAYGDVVGQLNQADSLDQAINTMNRYEGFGPGEFGARGVFSQQFLAEGGGYDPGLAPGEQDLASNVGNTVPVNASDQGVGSIGGGIGGYPSIFSQPTYQGTPIYGNAGSTPYGTGGIGGPTYATDSNIAGANSIVGSDSVDSQGQYASTNFSTVNPGDPGFNPNWNNGNSYTNPLVVTMGPAGTGSVGGLADTGAQVSGAASAGSTADSAAITAGPGMPVADQGLANAASRAGTTIGQAISNPLSQSVKGAGQSVQQGVQSAGQQISQTASGILAGAESYFGKVFVYIIIAVIGVVFVTVGLNKFGGPKIQVANVRA